MSTFKWGSLFSYVARDMDFESDDDGIARFYDIVLLKDFHNIREGTTFYQVHMDVAIGTIEFGNLKECPENECGKPIEFTQAFIIV